jgi:capsular exopolysaccharide synthesis family protein
MGTVYDALNKGQREMSRVAPVTDERLRSVRGPEGWAEFLTQVDPHLITHREADQAAVEQFKVLRTRLFLQNENPPRTLLVASSVTGEGKTLVAANLAIALALGLTGEALLIDCDLRRPSLHRLLGLSEKRGLADYLLREESLESLVVRTPLERLLLLPSGAVLQRNAPELLSLPRLGHLFAELAERFPEHRIICDCPPISAGPDAAILARHVDAALLVVKAQDVGREVVARSLEALGRQKVVGMVFNGSRSATEGERYVRQAA